MRIWDMNIQSVVFKTPNKWNESYLTVILDVLSPSPATDASADQYTVLFKSTVHVRI